MSAFRAGEWNSSIKPMNPSRAFGVFKDAYECLILAPGVQLRLFIHVRFIKLERFDVIQ